MDKSVTGEEALDRGLALAPCLEDDAKTLLGFRKTFAGPLLLQ
jgi:hypothetical protein